MKHYLIYYDGSGISKEIGGWITDAFETSQDIHEARRCDINEAHRLCQGFNEVLCGGHIIYEEENE